MILDGLLLFDSAAAVTASATTQASTNVLDLVNARDMAPGYPLRLLVQVITAFATTNSGVLTAALQGSTDNSTYTTMVQSQSAITPGNLVAGARIMDMTVPRPAQGQSLPRYLRMLYTVGVGVFSVGSVTAVIVLDRQDQVYYPAGVNVSN